MARIPLIPRMRYLESGQVEYEGPYNEYLISLFKIHIPASDRSYDPPTKIWTFDTVYATTALRLTREVFGDEVVVEDMRQTHRDPFQAQPSTIDPDCRIFYITADAPRFVLDAVYRAVVKEWHPDRLPAGEQGRGHERMVQINSAYARLRDRLAS